MSRFALSSMSPFSERMLGYMRHGYNTSITVSVKMYGATRIAGESQVAYIYDDVWLDVRWMLIHLLVRRRRVGSLGRRGHY